MPVNNSAYTNYGAVQSLAFCIEATRVLDIASVNTSAWEDIAQHTYIPFDEAQQYHPESDNYKRGATVKQADTILLYYPWQFNGSSAAVQSNDLTYYGSVSDPKGPAMTWAMFVINWLALGRFDTAQDYFDRSYANIQTPFDVWTETATGGGSVNFITGAGGFLQQFVFGYPGMRVNNDALLVDFKYLPWPQMSVVGVDFCENELDFVFYQTDVSFEVTLRRQSGKMSLDVVDANGERHALALNQTLHVSSDMNPVGVMCIQ